MIGLSTIFSFLLHLPNHMLGKSGEDLDIQTCGMNFDFNGVRDVLILVLTIVPGWTYAYTTSIFYNVKIFFKIQESKSTSLRRKQAEIMARNREIVKLTFLQGAAPILLQVPLLVMIVMDRNFSGSHWIKKGWDMIYDMIPSLGFAE